MHPPPGRRRPSRAAASLVGTAAESADAGAAHAAASQLLAMMLGTGTPMTDLAQPLRRCLTLPSATWGRSPRGIYTNAKAAKAERSRAGWVDVERTVSSHGLSRVIPTRERASETCVGCVLLFRGSVLLQPAAAVEDNHVFTHTTAAGQQGGLRVFPTHAAAAAAYLLLQSSVCNRVDKLVPRGGPLLPPTYIVPCVFSFASGGRKCPPQFPPTCREYRAPRHVPGVCTNAPPLRLSAGSR